MCPSTTGPVHLIADSLPTDYTISPSESPAVCCSGDSTSVDSRRVKLEALALSIDLAELSQPILT